MSILNRNRKPISDRPVYVSGIPYYALTKPNHMGEFEAVDVFGNRVVLKPYSTGGYGIVKGSYIPEGAIESLRANHPEAVDDIAVELDSIPGYRRYAGISRVSCPNMVDGSWFVRITRWIVGPEGRQNVDWTMNTVMSTSEVESEISRARMKTSSIETDGGEPPSRYVVRYPLDDGTMVVEYSRGTKDVRLPEVFEGPYAPPEAVSKNIRGRGRR